MPLTRPPGGKTSNNRNRNSVTMKLLLFACLAASASAAIDRLAVVRAFNPERTASSDETPLQVGNGNFAFGADITGLQTFKPFASMSTWAWHSFALPEAENQTSPEGMAFLRFFPPCSCLRPPPLLCREKKIGQTCKLGAYQVNQYLALPPVFKQISKVSSGTPMAGPSLITSPTRSSPNSPTGSARTPTVSTWAP